MKVHFMPRLAVVLGNSLKFNNMSPHRSLSSCKLLIKATNQSHTIAMLLTDATQLPVVNQRGAGCLMSMQNSFHSRMVLYKLESASSIGVSLTSISNMSPWKMESQQLLVWRRGRLKYSRLSSMIRSLTKSISCQLKLTHHQTTHSTRMNNWTEVNVQTCGQWKYAKASLKSHHDH